MSWNTTYPEVCPADTFRKLLQINDYYTVKFQMALNWRCQWLMIFLEQRSPTYIAFKRLTLMLVDTIHLRLKLIKWICTISICMSTSISNVSWQTVNISYGHSLLLLFITCTWRSVVQVYNTSFCYQIYQLVYQAFFFHSSIL